MATVVSGLTNYVPQNVNEVILAATFGTKFLTEAASKATVQAGVKTAANVLLLDGPVTLQSGNSCSWNASGSATITDKIVTVAPISIMEEICYDDVRLKYTQLAMMKGSKNFDEVAFAQSIVDMKTRRIAEENEKLVFQGDTGSATPNLTLFDGLLKQVQTGGVNSNVSQFTTSGPILTATGITNTNVIAIFNGIENATPISIATSTDRVVLCGADTARKFAQALTSNNWFNYTITQDGVSEFVIPGTSTRVIPVNGMNGSNMILSFAWPNMVMAIDGEGEHEVVELKYDEYSMKTRLLCKYKLGVTFARTSEVAYFKLA
jgi:hypothetical protein